MAEASAAMQPLVSYEQVQEANARYEAARDRLILSGAALIAAFVVIFTLRRRARARRGEAKASGSSPSSEFHRWVSYSARLVWLGSGGYYLWRLWLSDGEKPPPQLGFFTVVVFYFAEYFGKQAARIDASQKPAVDAASIDGAFVLYLRGFGAEDQPAQADGMLGMLTDPTSIEEAFLGGVASQLSVVALKNVARSGFPQPYKLVSVDGDQWQGRVGDLIAKADLVAVLVGTSPGLAWELSEILRLKALAKTAFVFPPGTPQEQSARWHALLDATRDETRVFDDASRALLLQSRPAWNTDDKHAVACAIAISAKLAATVRTASAGPMGYEELASWLLRESRLSTSRKATATTGTG